MSLYHLKAHLASLVEESEWWVGYQLALRMRENGYRVYTVTVIWESRGDSGKNMDVPAWSPLSY